MLQEGKGMKILLITVILGVFLSACSENNSSRLVEENSYDIGGGLFYKCVYFYDTTGLLTSRVYYGSNGDIYRKEEYIYKNGRLQEIVYKHLAENDIDYYIYSKDVFSYNGDKIKKMTHYDYDYDYDENEEVDYYYIFEFKNNKKIIQREYSPDGELICTYTFKYEGDRRIETCITTLGGDFIYWKRIYGDDGNLSQVNPPLGGKITFKWESEKSKFNYDDFFWY
jgi:hypothetical protein